MASSAEGDAMLRQGLKYSVKVSEALADGPAFHCSTSRLCARFGKSFAFVRAPLSHECYKRNVSLALLSMLALADASTRTPACCRV